MFRWFRYGVSALVLCVAAAACGGDESTTRDTSGDLSAPSTEVTEVEVGSGAFGDGDSDSASASTGMPGTDFSDDDTSDIGVLNDLGELPEFDEIVEQVTTAMSEFTASYVAEPSTEAATALTEAFTLLEQQSGTGRLDINLADIMLLEADFVIDSDKDQLFTMDMTGFDEDEFRFSFDMIFADGDLYARFGEISLGVTDPQMTKLLLGEFADRWVTVNLDEYELLGLAELGLLCVDPETEDCSPAGVNEIADTIIAAEFGTTVIENEPDSAEDSADWTHIRFIANMSNFGGDSTSMDDPFSDIAIPMHAWVDPDGNLRRLDLDGNSLGDALVHGFDELVQLDDLQETLAQMFNLRMSVHWASTDNIEDITTPDDIAGTLSDIPVFGIQ